MYTFSASTRQIGHLADVFNAVASVDSEALMVITPQGITVYGEHHHIINGTLNLSPGLFRTYNFYSEDTGNLTQNSDDDSKEELRLVLDIKLVSECLAAMKSIKIKATKPGDDDKYLGEEQGRETIGRGRRGKNVEASVDPVGRVERVRDGSLDALNPNLGGLDTPNALGGLDTPNALDGIDTPGLDTLDESKGKDTDKTCFITFNGDGHPFILEFEDNLITEKIEFLTRYVADGVYEDQGNIFVNHREIEMEMIVKSDVWANVLKDLKSIGTTSVYMYALVVTTTLNGQTLRGPKFIDKQVYFISKGPLGLLKLIFPNKRSILEKLDLFKWDEVSSSMVPTQGSITCHYNFASFYKIFGSVQNSIKCKIAKDLLGTLAVQMLCSNSQLANYPGTLVTFNMLGLLNEDGAYSNAVLEDLNANAYFKDDAIYEYNAEKEKEENLLHDYQPLDQLDQLEHVDQVEQVQHVELSKGNSLRGHSEVLVKGGDRDEPRDDILELPLFL